MKYESLKKMTQSLVKPALDLTATDENKDNESFVKLADIYHKLEVAQAAPSLPTPTAVKTKSKKYVPPGGFIGYRGMSIVNKSSNDMLYHGVSEDLELSKKKLEKDNTNAEIVAKVADISKLLLREFEAGRLVYVEPKPVRVTLLTRVKKFLKIK